LRIVLAAFLALTPAPLVAAPAPVPPLHYIARTLPNGLRVYEMPDKSGTTVSVQVWYDVGSKNDPTGRSGFAHLFEHLMFKATRDMSAETLDRLTEDVGGNNNASTDDDYTEYHEKVPANHLERLIWAEAERMGSLVVDQANFASEREVVKEELRGDFARPYGSLFYQYFPAANYRVHPYARSTIGSIADLDSATLNDVRAFHALYYRPDNAVLVVSGNFDPRQLDGWIDRYFGPIAKPGWAIPRVTVQEPARTGPARYVIHAANTPLPAVMLSWLIPPSKDRDHAAISVIDGILSGGESSRLYQALVYRDQIASEVDVNVDFKRDTGTLSAYAVMASGHSAAEGEAALRREIAALRNTPVSPAELSRVRNLIVTSALKQRETAEGRASILAAAVLNTGDPDFADKKLQAIQDVTPADIQRVARQLLPDDRTVTIHYMAPNIAPQEPQDRGPAVTIAPTVQTEALVPPPSIPIVEALDDAHRAAPPAPGPTVKPVLPKPFDRRLSNGMRLVLLEDHELPIATVHLVSPRGASDDPKGRAGLAELTADVLTKGTPTRTATAIANTVEALGGSLGADAARDGATLTLTVKSDQLGSAMALFDDVALHPTFAPAELERARTAAIDQLSQSYQTPAALGSLVAARAVYGDGPYGPPAHGTPLSLRAITRADLLATYRASWRPDTTTLVIAGDVTPERAAALGEQLARSWPQAKTPKPAGTSDQPLPKPRLIVVDFPETEQASVIVARATMRRSDPDYYAAVVANATLGGGYSSRLNREIRVKRGLAYGASSSLSAGRLPGPLTAATQTKNATVPDALAILQSEMRRMGREPVGAEELAARKATLIGNFGEAIETTDGQAALVAGLVERGIDPGEIDLYADKVAAVKPEDIERVSAALFDLSVASIVVVGKAEAFVPAMKAAGLDPEVIPAKALKLDTPGLR
jgi:zinc protease